jgi:hypothetical protein
MFNCGVDADRRNQEGRQGRDVLALNRGDLYARRRDWLAEVAAQRAIVILFSRRLIFLARFVGKTAVIMMITFVMTRVSDRALMIVNVAPAAQYQIGRLQGDRQ